MQFLTVDVPVCLSIRVCFSFCRSFARRRAVLGNRLTEFPKAQSWRPHQELESQPSLQTPRNTNTVQWRALACSITAVCGLRVCSCTMLVGLVSFHPCVWVWVPDSISPDGCPPDMRVLPISTARHFLHAQGGSHHLFPRISLFPSPWGEPSPWPRKHRKYKAPKKFFTSAPKLIYTVILWYSFGGATPPPPRGGTVTL